MRNEESYVAVNVSVPKGDELVLKHKNWKGAKAPELWVGNNSDGTLDKRVTMQLVTPELIEADKVEIYVAKGL